MSRREWMLLGAAWLVSALLGVSGAVLLSLAFGGCDIPTKSEITEAVDEQVDKALMECRAQADSAKLECRTSADEAAAMCQSGLDDLKEWAEAQAKAAGCIQDATTMAWDCPCK